jgi:hypothetical protein
MADLVAFEGDLDTLRTRGLISYGRSGKASFYVTPEGFRAYEKLNVDEGYPISRLQEKVRNYLNSKLFRDTYPAAFEKWSQADLLLWQGDSTPSMTTIGHLTREAMQEFAAGLAERFGLSSVHKDKSKTVARIKAALGAGAQAFGERERAFLEALVVYWGTVADLTQRQEHGAQREGTELVWQDARRVVFHTALVMFEVDLALSSRRK